MDNKKIADLLKNTTAVCEKGKQLIEDILTCIGYEKPVKKVRRPEVGEVWREGNLNFIIIKLLPNDQMYVIGLNHNVTPNPIYRLHDEYVWMSDNIIEYSEKGLGQIIKGP